MGSSSSYKSNMSNNSRAKPYAVMLLLAFGAAILGVMVLHKLRENRIYTLLVKQKDHELLTLHLLFQREQEFNKDARKKIEEMKTKVYSLRSQKLELDRRLLEMESTIASLRDERKVIESSLEEKKNEIKMLTEGGMNSTFSRVSALQDMKKMELEIEHLKLRLNKTEPDSTGVHTNLESKNESRLQSNDSFDKETKSEKGSQIDGVILQTSEYSTNEARKLDDVDGDEPRVKQEEKWVDDERVANGFVLNNKDENRESKASFHSARVVDVTAATVNDSKSSQDNIRDQESQDSSRAVRGMNGLGIRVRRRHSRGSRLRAVEAGGALSNLKESIIPNYTRKEVGPLEVHQAKSEKGQTRDTESNDRGSINTKPKGIEEAENENKGSSMSREGNKKEDGSTAANVTKIDDDIKRGHDIDANRKLLKMQNIDDNKHKGDNEEINEIEVDEGEGDDTEEIQEPEIDRADIKRFAESDLDEEEAEEAAEETEF